MNFSFQMFWQCEDVANMCCGMTRWLSWGVASWTKGELLGGARGSFLLFRIGEAHVRLWNEGTRTPYASFLSMELYEIYIQPPPFSYKQTALNKPAADLPLSASSVQFVGSHY